MTSYNFPLSAHISRSLVQSIRWPINCCILFLRSKHITDTHIKSHNTEQKHYIQPVRHTAQLNTTTVFLQETRMLN